MVWGTSCIVLTWVVVIQFYPKSCNSVVVLSVLKWENVTPVLKVSRIFNTFVITDTGYINHTIQKAT